MKKKLFKIIVCICVCLITLPSIFLNNTFADSLSVADVLVGINVYISSQDSKMTRLDFSYANLDLSKLLLQTSIGQKSSGEVIRWDSSFKSGSNSIPITITDPNITNTTSYIYTYEFVFNNDYIGSITLNDGSIIYVNGNKATFNSYSNSLSITSIELQYNSNYSFPIESFNFVNDLSIYSTGELIYTFGKYKYPIYNVPNNTSLIAWNADTLIFGTSTDINGAKIYETFTCNYDVVSVDSIFSSQNFNLWKFNINNSDGSFTNIIFSKDIDIMPVYFGDKHKDNLSTEFCEEFMLSNNFLDNIDKIANGTTESSSSSSQNEQATDSFSSSAQQFNDLENSFNSDLDNNLNNIDTSISTDNFGAKFLASAVFVRNCFDWLTADTPFESLITFSLTLGLALLIIGKALT